MLRNQELIQKQIITDILIRTLERDRKHLDRLKMQYVLVAWYEQQIKELRIQLKQLKSDLYKEGIEIRKEQHDGDVTVYPVLIRGKIDNRRYLNIALKNHTAHEMKRLLGMK